MGMKYFYQICVVFALVCISELHSQTLVLDAGDQEVSPVVVETTPTQLQQATEDNEIGQPARDIRILGDEFILNGKSLQIISGSVHYFRMPHQYWRDRIRKLKAAGFNAIATYVEWSYHEPEYRQYRFSGDYDVFEFVRIAAEEEMLVLLRPGPYICAERDLGGLPYWLLHIYPKIRLRTTDKNFIAETETWMEKLFEQMAPLLYNNGGPIILVQVENEYGSYSHDIRYRLQMRDIIKKYVGTKALLYTTDGPRVFRDGAIPLVLPTIDFGVGEGNATSKFSDLREFMPSGPLMNSEFYPGWLTHWGEKIQQVNKDYVVKALEDMINNKINVNIYVFFGGTNFEFSAAWQQTIRGRENSSWEPYLGFEEYKKAFQRYGANYMENIYLPDITSYDYDAPLNEAGDPTPKYYAIRELMDRLLPHYIRMEPPVPSPKGNYGTVLVTPQVDLLSSQGRLLLGKSYTSVTGSSLPTFERLQQRAGLMLYETTIDRAGTDILEVTNFRDRVYVYIDGQLSETMSRTDKRQTALLNLKKDSVLSLLVEPQGRINYGSHLHDFKGILGKVKWGDSVLDKKWSVTGFPLEDIENLPHTPYEYLNNSSMRGPVLYKGQFTLPEGETALDTFLDPTGWGKGYVWVNGHNLGRYWPDKGPQVTLYVPGVWLYAEPVPNTILILELQIRRSPDLEIKFIDYPILNRTELYG